MQRISSLARSGAVLVLAASGLAACATATPIRMSGPIAQGSSTPPPSASAPRAGSTSPGGRVPGTMKAYQIKGVWYYPAEQPDYDQVGIGSWYGEQFHNRTTSNGEIFDMDRISAAHKTLPLPSMVEVTNLNNGRKITLRVNDRGPFVDGRIIDLSKAAADELGYRDKGVARVRVRYLGPAPKNAFDGRQYAEGKVQPTPAPYKPGPYKPEPIAQVAPPKPRFALADSGGYRVQVASFVNRDNAERAASSLGQAVVESTERDGIPLYRVILGPADDEPAAWALRDRAAAQGFADARVLRP